MQMTSGTYSRLPHAAHGRVPKNVPSRTRHVSRRARVAETPPVTRCPSPRNSNGARAFPSRARAYLPPADASARGTCVGGDPAAFFVADFKRVWFLESSSAGRAEARRVETSESASGRATNPASHSPAEGTDPSTTGALPECSDSPSGSGHARSTADADACSCEGICMSFTLVYDMRIIHQYILLVICIL